MVLPITDVLLLLQRGYVDIGFLGGAQIDRYGNINSSFIGDPDHPKTRLPGTGGGNDISSLSHVMVVMKHEKRRFVEKVEFITSPGYLTGGTSRRDAGLLTGGPRLIVTDLAELDFHLDTKRMQIRALHPGVTREQVQANTGFELGVAADIRVTEPPTDREVQLLRQLDPDRLYTA
jgi:glutaconate CoA-transferase subunit B